MDIARIRKSSAAALLAAGAITIGGMTWAADVTPSGSSPAAVQSSQSVAEQVAAMRTEFGQKQQEAYQAYAAAEGKSDEERSKIYEEKSPNPTPYAEKALALAKANPKDPGAVDALLFVLQMTRGNGPQDERLDNEAIAQLSSDDLDNPQISHAFSKFMYEPSEAGTKLMRLAAEKSSNREVQGSAMFWLAQSLRNSAEQDGDQTKVAEAKKLYEKVAADYGDVHTGQRTLGEEAKANLYEMENLAIGKTAPDIEGKDANGKPLKLSDYAGKVVVLDFWGNW